jgi:iron complex outermembrane recepter protein
VTDELKFGDRWSVLVGGRYSDYHAQLNDYSTSAFVPVSALIFKPIPALTTYLAYSASLEPGGTASAPALNAGDQLEARASDQVELGAKLALFDRSLLLTAAAFSINADYYGDINAADLYVQDGSQDIEGIELNATGSITQNLRVILGGMLLDATLKNTGNPVQDDRPVPRGSASHRPSQPRLRDSLARWFCHQSRHVLHRPVQCV